MLRLRLKDATRKGLTVQSVEFWGSEARVGEAHLCPIDLQVIQKPGGSPGSSRHAPGPRNRIQRKKRSNLLFGMIHDEQEVYLFEYLI